MTRILVSAILVVLATGEILCAQSGGRFRSREESVSKRQAQILSAIFPGLGQLATGQRGRGTAMVAGEVGFVVVWLTSHADYNTRKEQFAIEEARYLKFRKGIDGAAPLERGGSFAESEESWQQLKDKKDDLDRSHTLRVAFGALSIALYTYNLVDVLWLDGASPKRVTLAPVVRPDGLAAVLVARF